jgi:hypothetical protein
MNQFGIRSRKNTIFDRLVEEEERKELCQRKTDSNGCARTIQNKSGAGLILLLSSTLW